MAQGQSAACKLRKSSPPLMPATQIAGGTESWERRPSGDRATGSSQETHLFSKFGHPCEWPAPQSQRNLPPFQPIHHQSNPTKLAPAEASSQFASVSGCRSFVIAEDLRFFEMQFDYVPCCIHRFGEFPLEEHSGTLLTQPRTHARKHAHALHKHPKGPKDRLLGPLVKVPP